MPSRAYIRNLIASADDDIPLVFIRLSSPDIPNWPDLSSGDDPTPDGWTDGFMYFVANDEDIMVDGIQHLAWGFEFTPPHQDGRSRTASFRMDNIDPRIFRAVKLLPSDTRINCRVNIALASDPSSVENSYSGFHVTAVNADFADLQFTVAGGHGGDAPANSVFYNPTNAVGLYS